jgi:hypothetical protein
MIEAIKVSFDRNSKEFCLKDKEKDIMEEKDGQSGQPPATTAQEAT